MSIKTISEINTEIINLQNKIKELEKEKFTINLLNECDINKKDLKDVENLSVTVISEENSSEQDEYAYSWHGKLIIEYLYKGTITPKITVSYEHDQTHYNRFSPDISFEKEYLHEKDGGPLIKKILEYIHNDCSDYEDDHEEDHEEDNKEIRNNWKDLIHTLE
tara:strand:+ start:40 stop:528 length:489 start_codon:yes stop_codon:yes gene_type:complete